MRRMPPFDLSIFIVTLLIIDALYGGTSIYRQLAYGDPPKVRQTVQSIFTDLSDDEIQAGNFSRSSPDGLPGAHLRIAQLDWNIVSAGLKGITRVCLPLTSSMDCREFFPVKPPSTVQKFAGPEGTIARLSWIGRINGDASSEAVFIVRERDQAISGTIRYQGHIYDIRPVGRATISIVEVDPQLYVADTPPRVRNRSPRMPDKSPKERRSSSPARITPQADKLTLPLPSTIQVQTGQKTKVDVMVVYTKQAKTTVEDWCKLCLITDNILVAVGEANSSLGPNSQLEFRLVYVNEVDYPQHSVNTDLSYLQGKGGPTDPFLNQVHQWRRDNKADVVSLWVEYDNPEPCGESYGPMKWVSSGTWDYNYADPENWAFSVVRRNCAANFLTFHHELGHVMGADHDRADVERRGGPPLTGYGYGYVNESSHEATIMGVPIKPAWFVNMWSSPSDPFPTGSSAGTSIDNNLRVLNETAGQVSRFSDRLYLDNSPPAEPSDLREE
ncbi:MAG: hypothetical protein KF693_08240 [Nitrospira sp.]|nr:hypothetical protein [Nitrospira sp.]